MQRRLCESAALKKSARIAFLIRTNVTLVHRIASRWIKRNVNVADDVLSNGYFGLVEAAQRFDPERGISFERFATQRIVGAIKDGFRNMDPLSRAHRRRVRELSRRAPVDTPVNPAHLASSLGWSEAQTRCALADLALGGGIEVSFEVVGASITATLRTLDQTSEDRCIVHELVEMALAQLSPRERRIFKLYYWEELTMEEIASQLGLTEGRISQIHLRALAKIRASAA